MNQKIKDLETLCAGLDYKITEDTILMANAKLGALHYGIELNQCTPTFILRSDNQFIAVIIQGTKKVDFTKIRECLGAKNVSMATKEEIMDVTGSSIGSVSMINAQLKTLIDNGIKELEYCYGGCGVEKYTLKIKSADLIRVTNASVGDFTKPKQ
jgi:Ala-tRNA(Pro) deacylase